MEFISCSIHFMHTCHAQYFTTLEKSYAQWCMTVVCTLSTCTLTELSGSTFSDKKTPPE